MARKGLITKTIALPNGKRKYFYGTTEREVYKKILKYTEAQEKGKKFSAVCDEWEAIHYTALEYSTVSRYKCFVKYAVAEFGDCFIKDIEADDINSFMIWQSKHGCTSRTLNGMSAKSLKEQLNVIKMIFKYAKMKKYISDNPTEYLLPPKGKKAVKREALTDDEIKIINQSTGCTFGLLAYFLLYTGLRKGEALALTFRDLDRSGNLIDVNKAVYYKSNNPHIKKTKTDAGTRIVACPNKLMALIPEGEPEEYIFGKKDRPLKKSEFETGWKHYLKETDLSITAHQLRHTYCTLLWESGVNEKEAQVLMGHADISVTQNVYTHLRESRYKTNLVNKINALIK